MQSKPEYISYERAMAQLRKSLDATPEELAAWVFMSSQQACAKKFNGPRCTNEALRCTNEVLHHGDMCELHGGLHAQADKAKLIEHKRHNLVAFTNANEFDQPLRFFFGSCLGKPDYLPLLYRCWFKADDIATFEPGERFITGKMLLGRWEEPDGISAAERIEIAREESRLNPVHPTLGLSNKARPDYAPLEDGLFSLTEVKAYEREEFGGELDATGASSAPAAKGKAAQGTNPSGDAPHALGSLEVFRSMINLSGEELSIAFIGDKPEHKDGIGANNMLKISARKETRTVAFASLDLVNKNPCGGVNGEGGILILFSRGQTPAKTESNATKMSRLRNIFKNYLGVTSSPFHVKALGWKPRFTIKDKRGEGEARNKREIERYKTVSLDEMNERGEMASNTNQTQQSSGDDYPFDKEYDETDNFLSGNNA